MAARAVPAPTRWQHFLYVTRALTATEFKLRYFGSVLGYLWTLLRPLMVFGVLYLVFTQIFRFGANVPHYPVMLLLGLILWTFFADATSSSLPRRRRTSWVRVRHDRRKGATPPMMT